MGSLATIGAGIALTLGASFVVGSLLIARREPVPAAAAPSEPHTSWVETRSGRVSVLDLGSGDVVLLVHGSGRSLADWEEGFAEELARTFRVVAFDNYGFGRSDRNHGWEYGISLWARQAVDLLDALGIERAVILGHSSGAAVAAIVSAEHPERIRGAVLVGHGLAVDPAQIVPAIPGIGELWASQIAENGETYSPMHRTRLEESYRIRGTRSALLMFIRRQFTIDGLRLIGGTYEKIRVPVLQAHGTKDASIPIKAARSLSRRIPNVRFVEMETGHSIHAEQPVELADEVRRFVEGLDR
jgi:2-hydroxymuconate-semialdehyde hydrolase